MIGERGLVAPDLIEHTIVYRQWQLRMIWPGQLKLKSPLYHETWDDGERVAVCQGHPLVSPRMRRSNRVVWHHLPPVLECTCGIYGFYSPRHKMARHFIGYTWDGRGKGTQAIGAIKCWGRIIPYSEGIRAEKAQIVCLAYRWWWRTQHKRLIRRWAEANNVPVVRYWRLKHEASKHGKPLPQEMVPPKTPWSPVYGAYGIMLISLVGIFAIVSSLVG